MLAAAALVAACVAALLPARTASETYVWPPPGTVETASAAEADGFYAPLPLLNRVPGRVELLLPCDLSPPARAEAPRTTVLATARSPGPSRALGLVLDGDALAVAVGATEVARVDWPGSCPLRLAVEDGRLTLPSGSVALDPGTLDDMPVVTGVFTQLDLTRGAPPEVTVDTRRVAVSQTPAQKVFVGVAVALAVAALLALAQATRGRRPSARQRLAALWAARRPVDAAVVVALAGWWILAPALTDDGWLWVEHRVFDDVGTNAFYYDTWGVGSPIGFWLEWLRHWPAVVTSDLVFLRLPTLAVLVVAWVACRWCFERVADAVRDRERWVLAGLFLVFSTAWGMTLRPEPFTSLLALIGLAGAIAFARHRRALPLAVAAVAAALSASAHPAGIVAVAPLVAVVPEVVRWYRGARREALLGIGAVSGLGVAALVLAVTLDSDLASRLTEASIAREGDLHREPWWREYIRYTQFDQFGGEIPVRRLSLGLLVGAVVAWIVRGRGLDDRVSTVPARAVAAALVILAVVPSKWPWHFGTLMGVGALAAAAEGLRVARTRGDDLATRARAVAALLAVAGVVSWAVAADDRWNQLDLMRTSWDVAFGFGLVHAVLFAVVVAAVAVVLARREPPPSLTVRATAGASWLLATACFAAVGLTAIVLAFDARGASWALARQNLGALTGRAGCGYADRLDAAVRDRIGDPGTRTLLVPAIGLYLRCATVPATVHGVVEVPDLVVFVDSPWPLEEHDGPFAAVADLYATRQIAKGPNDVVVLEVDRTISGLTRLDALRRT